MLYMDNVVSMKCCVATKHGYVELVCTDLRVCVLSRTGCVSEGVKPV